CSAEVRTRSTKAGWHPHHGGDRLPLRDADPPRPVRGTAMQPAGAAPHTDVCTHARRTARGPRAFAGHAGLKQVCRPQADQRAAYAFAVLASAPRAARAMAAAST